MPQPLLLARGKVTDADPGSDLSAPDLDDSSWLDIEVPGDLHRALVRAGRIPEPNHGDNAAECAWVEEREWWWRIPFSADPVSAGERVQLTAHGLDTFATIYLNGIELGRHRNMFRPVGFDITDAVGADNVLAICFRRPLAEVDNGDGASARSVVARMRKAQLSYGWDFAPRRPALGPWLPIEIARSQAPLITTVQVQTVGLRADHTSADVEVRVALDGAAPVDVDITISGPDGSTLGSTTVAATGTAGTRFTLDQPALWWPHDRGRPDLHTAAVTVRADGQAVDTRTTRFGVRTIELNREPDDFGRAFTFVVNGEPISANGANWVPADLALAEPDDERYRSLITAARDANMNMLRIWGGGIYEHEIFYDICDELGVLVWQDFMFACLPYSDDQDADWLAEIEAEAIHQVRRLRSHPSLALWCGNNEVAMIAELVIGAGVRPGERIFEELLPSVVAREDGATSYISTTPLVGPLNEVDRHCWKVWHGIDETRPDLYVPPASMDNDGTPVDPHSELAELFVKQAGPQGYLTDLSRFTSEYGLASTSDLETLQRWTDPEHLVLGDPQIESRLTPASRGPANKFDLLCNAISGEPHDLVDYTELSQLAQAEGLKVGMEHYRRGWPRCGGSLIWMLNDCWPATSWSLIDFDGRKKAAYHYAKRAFAAALASFAPVDGGLELWLTNNSRAVIADELVVRRLTFEGDVKWETAVPVDAAPATSAAVLALPADALAEPTTSYLEVRARGDAVAPNRQLLAPLPQLRRELVPPTFDWRTNGREITTTVTATTLCLATHITVHGPSIDWSDDFFDLAPGESRTITTGEAFDTDTMTISCR